MRAAKAVLFLLCLLPLLRLLQLGVGDALGANPIEFISRYTGDWTLRFLLITLAVTPLRRLTGWPVWQRFRRMLGLFAFFYAGLHFLTYLVLDQSLQLAAVWEDIAERPYITAGFAAFLLLIPLAATSTQVMMRRLGGRRWRRLHRLVYLAAIGGVIHFLWLVKSDLTRPLIYAAALALLLAYRVQGIRRRRL